MATTRAVLRQSQMLKKALFAGQVKPQTLVAARWGSGEPDQWNYLWRPESKWTFLLNSPNLTQKLKSKIYFSFSENPSD